MVRRMTIVVIAVVTSALLLNVLEVPSTVAYVDESETDTDQEIRQENICSGFAVCINTLKTLSTTPVCHRHAFLFSSCVDIFTNIKKDRIIYIESNYNRRREYL
jgi:hypothetical protein